MVLQMKITFYINKAYLLQKVHEIQTKHAYFTQKVKFKKPHEMFISVFFGQHLHFKHSIKLYVNPHKRNFRQLSNEMQIYSADCLKKTTVSIMKCSWGYHPA